jgi:hypothetical protein
MSTDQNTAEEQKAPSKEEVIAFFQEQIDVKKVQLELQQLNTALAVARMEEVKALALIGQITNPRPEPNPYQGGTPHTITQQDLDQNPELAQAGVQVGDEVIIPDQEDHSTQKRTLKKNK